MSEESSQEPAQNSNDPAGDSSPDGGDPAGGGATPEGQNPEGGEGGEGEAGSQEPSLPEQYEPFTLPNDLGTLRDESHQALSGYLKKHGLGQEAGQEAVDLHARFTKELLAHQASEFENQVAVWAEDSKNHPSLGGEDFKKNLGSALRVVEAFSPKMAREDGKGVFDPETGKPVTKLGELLNKTGLGNHPDMFEFLVNVHSAISEDKLVPQTPTGTVKKSREEIMYPEMAKKAGG